MLKVLLRHEATLRVHELLLPVGEAVCLGRAPSNAVVVDDQSVSGHHIEIFSHPDPRGSGPPLLWARDLSRNGTGLLDPERGVHDVRRLNTEEAEQLFDGAELVVPLRRNRGGVVDGPEVAKHHFVVEIPADQQDALAAAAGGSLPSTALPGKRQGLDTSGLPDVYDAATGTGRWRYEQKLGEGGLGVVYRCFDCTGSLGEVAVKVLKRNARTPHRDARHAFAMHRESQWSLLRLHDPSDSRYDEKAAGLFARYLEDHTGFAEMEPQCFDAKRKLYEARDFNWDHFCLELPPRPYVVIELVPGESLQTAIDRDRRPASAGDEHRAFTAAEKRKVLLDAARALEYLAAFRLIHRDFRGCNMHLVARASEDGSVCRLKVLDFGIMIAADEGQESNSNAAVQAFRRRGDTEEKRRRYDWLPWEVRLAYDDPKTVNFSPPPFSFDVFSFGVLVMHLLFGKTEARAKLERLEHGERLDIDARSLGLDAELVRSMLGEPTGRPAPAEVLAALLRAGDAPASVTAPCAVGNAVAAASPPVAAEAAAEEADDDEENEPTPPGVSSSSLMDAVRDEESAPPAAVVHEVCRSTAANGRSRSRSVRRGVAEREQTETDFERKQRERRERWQAAMTKDDTTVHNGNGMAAPTCATAPALLAAPEQPTMKVPEPTAAQVDQSTRRHKPGRRSHSRSKSVSKRRRRNRSRSSSLNGDTKRTAKEGSGGTRPPASTTIMIGDADVVNLDEDSDADVREAKKQQKPPALANNDLIAEAVVRATKAAVNSAINSTSAHVRECVPDRQTPLVDGSMEGASSIDARGSVKPSGIVTPPSPRDVAGGTLSALLGARERLPARSQSSDKFTPAAAEEKSQVSVACAAAPSVQSMSVSSAACAVAPAVQSMQMPSHIEAAGVARQRSSSAPPGTVVTTPVLPVPPQVSSMPTPSLPVPGIATPVLPVAGLQRSIPGMATPVLPVSGLPGSLGGLATTLSPAASAPAPIPSMATPVLPVNSAPAFASNMATPVLPVAGTSAVVPPRLPPKEKVLANDPNHVVLRDPAVAAVTASKAAPLLPPASQSMATTPCAAQVVPPKTVPPPPARAPEQQQAMASPLGAATTSNNVPQSYQSMQQPAQHAMQPPSQQRLQQPQQQSMPQQQSARTPPVPPPAPHAFQQSMQMQQPSGFEKNIFGQQMQQMQQMQQAQQMQQMQQMHFHPQMSMMQAPQMAPAMGFMMPMSSQTHAYSPYMASACPQLPTAAQMPMWGPTSMNTGQAWQR
eukprot:TRINITY_DN313_c0_g1_i1.p1 TRINITY_DN313_c0_g1~~TRINITY_DN313_c0_g1_i1.p1  ORF type:complete len:1259 (+),score=246.01 TRINITY_DN313_c0_g1_i1:155-3931(+)